MEEHSICTAQTPCISLAIVVALLLILIFFNHMVRYITLASQPDPSLPTTVPPNTLLPDQHPLFRHVIKFILPAEFDAPTPPSDTTLEKESCAVCLAEFEKGEIVRVLPKCNHVYHIECIDKWLMRSLHCPICRERVIDQRQCMPKALMVSGDVDLTGNANQPLPITANSFVLNVGCKCYTYSCAHE
ncbi:hypothetical protein Cgig2_019595 [Carnegiea gigantea]|uniref:RING-type domain-containing protein n=1 Tax=Carnegiea gigantea TaxID=171969 RepID=A0A9Q1KIU0_9CARY|nr:hypothetical protein Cgig2_019595 [Carnegiea gigantea]